MQLLGHPGHLAPVVCAQQPHGLPCLGTPAPQLLTAAQAHGPSTTLSTALIPLNTSRTESPSQPGRRILTSAVCIVFLDGKGSSGPKS